MPLCKEDFIELINRSDSVGMHAIGRALVHLNNRQTMDEQSSETTKWHNKRGFRPSHAAKGTGMAKFYTAHGYLSPKQVAFWLKTMRDGNQRLAIYWRQISEEVDRKAGRTDHRTES